MTVIPTTVIAALVSAILAFIGGYIIRKLIAEAKIASAEEAAKKMVADAIKEADAKRREAILEAKEEIHRLRMELTRNQGKARATRIDKCLAQKRALTASRKTQRKEDDPAEGS